jgi:hypothetical protein
VQRHPAVALSIFILESASWCIPWAAAVVLHLEQQTVSVTHMRCAYLRQSTVAGCSRRRGCADVPSRAVESKPLLATARMHTTGTAAGSQAAATAITPGSCSAFASCSPAEDSAAYTAERGFSSW